MAWVSDLQDLRKYIEEVGVQVDKSVQIVSRRHPRHASDLMMTGKAMKEMLTQIERSIADIIIKNIE